MHPFSGSISCKQHCILLVCRIVQMELENHKHAAAAYQESADSPDMDTALAAIPTAARAWWGLQEAPCLHG